ncbi:MAG: hypothetical protein KAX91_06005, partial [Xylophilus sp.]|nr:hypothetical protein [Xylophilus sp.]
QDEQQRSDEEIHGGTHQKQRCPMVPDRPPAVWGHAPRRGSGADEPQQRDFALRTKLLGWLGGEGLLLTEKIQSR